MIANLAGQQFGNYRLIRLLGEGGFAQVYLGEHIHLGTQAAIKVLHTRLTNDDREHFRAEARTIARLDHPHIVRVFDFGVEGTIPFLAMTYAPNGTLRQMHPKGTRVPLALVVLYVKEIVDALQYAHSQHVIHRDIKPENLLLGRDKEVLLSDFGIALVTQSSRTQGTKDITGTIAYMAPEQIEAHPRSASDQYALGIVVYEWLSSERPFHGSFTEIAIKHSLTPPPSLCEKVPTLSPAIENIVFTALAKKPEQRFASVQAFATALEQAYQADQPHSPTIVSSSWHQPSQPIARTPLSHQPGSYLQASSSVMPHDHLPTPDLRATFSNPQKPSRKNFSRRTVVVGLAAAAVVGVGATLFTLYENTQPPLQNTQPPSQNTQPPLQAATDGNHTASATAISNPTPPDTTQATKPPLHTGNVIGSTDLPLNTAKPFTNPADGKESLLVHLPNGNFVAYERACTHQGVAVYYDANTHMLICPAHGAVFDPANGGAVLQGPATTPIARASIRVNADGTITTG